MLQLAGFEDTDVDSKELDAERRRLDAIQMGSQEPMEVDPLLPSERNPKRKFDEVEAPRRITIEMLLNDRLVDRVVFDLRS